MKKRLRLLAFVATIVTLCAIATSGATAQILCVPEVFQEQNQWCWAGTSRAALLYYGTDVAQCDIANFARVQNGWGADDCCVNPGGAICNQPNWLYGAAGSILNILANWGVNSVGSARHIIAKVFCHAWQYTKGSPS